MSAGPLEPTKFEIEVLVVALGRRGSAQALIWPRWREDDVTSGWESSRTQALRVGPIGFRFVRFELMEAP